MTSRAPLIGALTAVLLAVAFYFLLYSPRNDDLAAVREETVALETQRASLVNEVAHLREIEGNQVQIRAALARLEEYIPTGTAQSTAVRQFQLVADASGVEIISVVFAPPVPVLDAPPTGSSDTVLASVPVTMTLDGGYFQAVDFFRRLEVETPRALLLSDLSLVEGEDEFPALTTTWNGLLFAVVPAPVLPLDPAAAPEAPAPAEGAEPAEGTEPAEGAEPAEGTEPAGTVETTQSTPSTTAEGSATS